MHKHEITLDLNSFVFRLGYLRKFIGSYHVDELILLDSRERIYIYIYMICTCHRKVLIYHFDIWSIGNIVIDNSRSYMVHGS